MFVIMRVRWNFSRGATSKFCLYVSGCWRCNATDGLLQSTLPFLHQRKWPKLGQQLHKYASLAAITGQITTYDNLQNNLCQDFQSMALLFKEVLHWSLKKP